MGIRKNRPFGYSSSPFTNSETRAEASDFNIFSPVSAASFMSRTRAESEASVDLWALGCCCCGYDKLNCDRCERALGLPYD